MPRALWARCTESAVRRVRTPSREQEGRVIPGEAERGEGQEPAKRTGRDYWHSLSGPSETGLWNTGAHTGAGQDSSTGGPFWLFVTERAVTFLIPPFPNARVEALTHQVAVTEHRTGMKVQRGQRAGPRPSDWCSYKKRKRQQRAPSPHAQAKGCEEHSREETFSSEEMAHWTSTTMAP